MSNTTARLRTKTGLAIGAVALALGLGEPSQATSSPKSQSMNKSQTSCDTSKVLTARQLAIGPVAAFAAAGNMKGLSTALNQGLDAGLSVSDAKEILVQLYAYAGFPRSLNALGELMKVLEVRKQQGIADAPGSEPVQPIPKGDQLLAAGTTNQTKLLGATVKGPLFDFAPVANEYLRSHLFGDIFERDNLDWQSRELATVSMLAALEGVEPQLQAHIRISMNIGLSTKQLRQLSELLGERVSAATGQRAINALETVSTVPGC